MRFHQRKSLLRTKLPCVDAHSWEEKLRPRDRHALSGRHSHPAGSLPSLATPRCPAPLPRPGSPKHTTCVLTSPVVPLLTLGLWLLLLYSPQLAVLHSNLSCSPPYPNLQPSPGLSSPKQPPEGAVSTRVRFPPVSRLPPPSRSKPKFSPWPMRSYTTYCVPSMPTSSPSPPCSLCSRHTGLFTVPPTHQAWYLPQGLCMGCPLCLECCSPDFPGAPSLSPFKSPWVKHNSQGQLTLAFPCQATPVSPDIWPFTYCLPRCLLSSARGPGPDLRIGAIALGLAG